MKMSKKIIIPDIDMLDEQQYSELIDIMDSLPVGYEVWKEDN